MNIGEIDGGRRTNLWIHHLQTINMGSDPEPDGLLEHRRFGLGDEKTPLLEQLKQIF